MGMSLGDREESELLKGVVCSLRGTGMMCYD